jgi:hypothetical protein
MKKALPIGMLLVFVIFAAALGGVEPFYAPPASSPIGQRDEPLASYAKLRTVKPAGDTIYGIPEKHLADPVGEEADTTLAPAEGLITGLITNEVEGEVEDDLQDDLEDDLQDDLQDDLEDDLEEYPDIISALDEEGQNVNIVLSDPIILYDDYGLELPESTTLYDPDNPTLMITDLDSFIDEFYITE